MKFKLFTVAAGMLVLSGTVLPVFAAETSLGGDANVKTNIGGVHVETEMEATASATSSMKGHDGLIVRAKSRADEEILRRINALQKLDDRMSGMQRLSGDEMSRLSDSIKAQIQAMTNLQAKITTDADDNATSAMKIDIKSIADSYRIFMLVMPQAAITAAADRVMSIASAMSDLAAKFQTRIATAQSAGADVSTAVTALADFNAKVADANVQAQAAISEVSTLTPDSGDQAKLQTNLAALKDARAKVVAAQKDLNTARDDAKAIIKVFASAKVNVHATTTASTTTENDQ